ncbi:LPS biosynthesis protein [Actinomycetota bacterium]|nr:LPS biosynthesis protein [Actinomycetota bacterium]
MDWVLGCAIITRIRRENPVRKYINGKSKRLVVYCLTHSSVDSASKFFLDNIANYCDELKMVHSFSEVELSQIKSFDEVVLAEDTFFGPIYDFGEMFNKMNMVNTSSWKITKYSPFIAIRKPKLFKKLKFPLAYSEADSFYIQDENILGKGATNSLLDTPVKLLRDRRCPIVSQELFTVPHSQFLVASMGELPRLAFDYILEKTDFDVNLIWDKILRTGNLYNIQQNLAFTSVMPRGDQTNEIAKSKTALVIHSYFPDLVEYLFNYAKSIPSYLDVYITTPNEEHAQKVREVFSALECAKLEVRVVQNRGRSESALLVGVKDVIMDYELVCYVHDKKTNYLSADTVGESWSYRCFENILSTPEYVQNVIHLFSENTRLGCLFPPPPNHADFISTVSTMYQWGENYESTVKLAEQLGLNVNIDEDYPPVAPVGGMFWFRPKAFEKLYARNWEYADFPPEPNNSDNTLLHAIERIYAYTAQDAGFYSSFCMTDEYAAIEQANLGYYANKLFETMYAMGIQKSMATQQTGVIKQMMVASKEHSYD